jgi:4-alpha-glucanotransferase
MCENRELRRIFGPKREKVARGCRTLHEELHNVRFIKYYYGEQIKEMGGICSTHGTGMKFITYFGRKT